MESMQNQSETSAAEIAKLRELVEGEPQAFFILVGAIYWVNRSTKGTKSSLRETVCST